MLLTVGVGGRGSYFQNQVATFFFDSNSYHKTFPIFFLNFVNFPGIAPQKTAEMLIRPEIFRNFLFFKYSHVIHHFFANFMQIKNVIIRNVANEFIVINKVKCHTLSCQNILEFVHNF